MELLEVTNYKKASSGMFISAAKDVADTPVHVATVTVQGNIGGEDPKYAPDLIAKEYWTLYEQQHGAYEVERLY